MFVGAGFETAGEGEGAGLDGREGVADFVGDTGGEDTEGGEFFATFEGEAGFLEAGVERGDEVVPDEGSEAADEGEEGEQGTDGEAVEGADGVFGVGEVGVQDGSMVVFELGGKGEEGE